jgi:hypothetical protein
MRFTFLFLFALFILGCGGNRKPKNLIPDDKIADLLVELHMFDAIATDYTVNQLTGDFDSLTIYSSVLAKYGTNREGFEATMKWYSNNPEDLSKLYDNVFGIINRNHQDLNDQLDLFNFGGKKSEIIYSSSKYRDIRGDTIKYPDPLIIKTDSTGTYFFDIRLRMFNDDKSKNPRILGYFTDNDTVVLDSLEIINFPIMKSNYSRDYQFKVELTDTVFKFIKLTIPEVDSLPFNFYKNLQLSSIKVAKKIDEKKDTKEEEPVKTED